MRLMTESSPKQYRYNGKKFDNGWCAGFFFTDDFCTQHGF